MTNLARMSALTFVMLVVQCFAAFADTPKRVALVIGNATYQSVPRLANPTNDAADIAHALDRLDFEVTVETDLDSSGMTRALGRFSRKARTADMAVLFYAGHGIEIDNQNYLIPTDAELNHVDDVAFEAIRLEQLLRAVEGAETLKLVLLDACRDNPFSFAAGSRSLGRGLTRVEPSGGVLVSYAARSGTVAFDGEGRNSPYTSALLEHLEEPNLEVGKLFRRVRDAVYRNTRGSQEPFTYGSLPSRDIFLSEQAADPILEDFNVASSAGTVAAWDSFLTKHQQREDKPVLMTAARNLRAAVLPQPEPVIDEIQGDFDAASTDGSVAAWDAFLAKHAARTDKPALLRAGRNLRDAALPKPEPVIDEIQGDFDAASIAGTADAWAEFLDKHGKRDDEPALLRAARDLHAAAQPKPAREPVVVPIFEDFDTATDAGTVADWDAFLEQYSESHAGHFLITAALNLRAAALPEPEAQPAQPTSTAVFAVPTLLTPEETEEALNLTAEQRKDVQRLLYAIGYQPGPADGVWGKKTRKALAAFQNKTGIMDTGFVNQATITGLSETFEAAPNSQDGRWRLSIERHTIPGSRFAREGNNRLIYNLGFVDFDIRGRTVETVKSVNMSSAPNPKDAALRATLNTNGTLTMSLVVNYLFFKNNFRRLSMGVRLPDRVLVGQEFLLPAGSVSQNYRIAGRLRRISAD